MFVHQRSYLCNFSIAKAVTRFTFHDLFSVLLSSYSLLTAKVVALKGKGESKVRIITFAFNSDNFG
jgi:hypothetical protein